MGRQLLPEMIWEKSLKSFHPTEYSENSSESIIYVEGIKLLTFRSIKCSFNIFLYNGSKENYNGSWNFLVYLLCKYIIDRSFYDLLIEARVYVDNVLCFPTVWNKS